MKYDNDLKQVFRIYFEEKIDYEIKKKFLSITFEEYAKAEEYVLFLNELKDNLSSNKRFKVEVFYE